MNDSVPPSVNVSQLQPGPERQESAGINLRIGWIEE